VLPFISAAKSANEAYETLQELFGEQSAGNLQTLMYQYRTFTMHPSEDIPEVHARFKQLTSSLKLAGNEMRELDQCMVFLHALPPEFDVYKKVLMMGKIQSLSDIVMACMRAQGEIRQEAAAAADKVSEGVYHTVVRSSGSSKYTFKGNCNYCKEEGHRKSECPKLAEKKAREQQEKEVEEKEKKRVNFTMGRVW
jgi:hypothetical protein